MTEPFLAILAHASVLEPLRVTLPSSTWLSLPQGLALAPLCEPLRAHLLAGADEPPSIDGFAQLHLAARCCSELSRSGPVVYVEMERAAGRAREAAAVFRDGQLESVHTIDAAQSVVCAPHDDAPVNVALRALGVARGTAPDERRALGLHGPR